MDAQTLTNQICRVYEELNALMDCCENIHASGRMPPEVTAIYRACREARAAFVRVTEETEEDTMTTPLQIAVDLLIKALPWIDPDDPGLADHARPGARGLELRVRNFIEKHDNDSKS